jgi:hypothetical protein
MTPTPKKRHSAFQGLRTVTKPREWKVGDRLVHRRDERTATVVSTSESAIAIQGNGFEICSTQEALRGDWRLMRGKVKGSSPTIVFRMRVSQERLDRWGVRAKEQGIAIAEYVRQAMRKYEEERSRTPLA